MISPYTPESITKAAELLRQGGLVVFPTETVYGLGADAFNEKAVRRIYEVKGRPSNNPLIVHISSPDELEKVAVVESRRDILKRVLHFWPGPMTLVMEAHPSLPRTVTGGRQSVAVRIPSHPAAMDLLCESRLSVAAPSANVSSRISATTAQHVEETLGSKVDMIIDGGPCRIGVESTILSLLQWPPRVLRPGGISLEQLSDALGVPVSQHSPAASSAVSEVIEPLAPGMLKEHYAPNTPLAFRNRIQQTAPEMRIGLMSFGPKFGVLNDRKYAACTVLSERSDLDEVANRLFSALHEMDKLRLDLILVDSCGEDGIGRAIMDRLRRATAGFTDL